MAEVDVLVVGGGLAGLAAALEAQRQGRSVQVLERASRLGGKAGSTQLPSGLFPDGPVSFNGRAAVFWRFLELLVRNPGRLVTRQTILREIWGSEFTADSGYLRLYMSQLRKKLEADPSHPQHLLTEAGMGYRLRIGAVPDA